MLPDDSNPSAAEVAPEPAPPARPDPAAAPSDAIPDTQPSGGPEPTGYVAGPAPVPVGGRPSRRGPVLAVALVVVAVLGGSALFISGYTLGRQQGTTAGTPSNLAQEFQPFWDTYNAVSSQYALGPVDPETLVTGAIKGLVDGLGDPYSTYLSPADYQSSLQDISGQFEGIGTEIGTIDSKGNTVECNTFGPDCRLEITKPLDGSPALQAGIKAGDVITAVDGKTIDGLTPDQARDEIRGPAGTTVKLTIDRQGQSPFDVTVTRAKIQEQEVVTKDLANGAVGYVQLTGFSDAGADAFVAAVKADVAKGQKKVVVDLRGNPGGFINDAQKVASVFIASGPIFYEEFADCHLQEWDASGGAVAVATHPSIQVTLLVDGGSASAAEIVTGALHDTGRATIVGAKTFGKGTVQEWITLDQLGAVKLTIAKWLTPDKDWIHKIGITPDVPVAVPANTPAGQDPVLDKAVSLLTGTTPPGASPTPEATPAPTSSAAPGASAAPADTQPPNDCSATGIAPSPGASTVPGASDARYGSWLVLA